MHHDASTLDPTSVRHSSFLKSAYARSIAQDVIALAILAALTLYISTVYWRTGLDCNPDSGYYLYFAARLHLYLDYASGSAMYAPLFPFAIATCMYLAKFPGEAAVLVVGASLAFAAASIYVMGRTGRGPWYLALGGALLVLSSPVVRKVYANIWSDGLLIGLVLGSVACYSAWVWTDRVRLLALAFVAGALAGLTKYIAMVIPVCLVLAAVWKEGRSLTRRKLLRLCIFATLACTPTCLAIGYNRIMLGVWTGHALPKRSAAENWQDLAGTLTALVPPGIWVVCLFGIGILPFWRRWRLDREASAALFCCAATTIVGCMYTFALVAAASRLGVDPLRTRLASPIVVLMYALALQTIAFIIHVCRATNRRLAISAAFTVVVIAMTVYPARDRIADLATLLARGDKGHVRLYEKGAGIGTTRRKLSAFLAAELERSPTVAIAFLELGEEGRVHRHWLSVANALSRSPLQAPAGEIVDVDRRFIEIAPRGKQSRERILILIPAMPALGRVAPGPALAARMAAIMDRLLSSMDQGHVRVLWAVASQPAAWFRSALPERTDLSIARPHRLGNYAAYRIESNPNALDPVAPREPGGAI